MNINFSDHPFVKFVEQLTSRPLTQAALNQLELQNTLNVNLILYAIWHGQKQRGRLLRNDLKKLLSAVHSWHGSIRLALQRSINTVKNLNFKKSQTLQEILLTELKLTNQIEQRLIAETLFKFNYQKRNPTQQLSDACYSITSYCNFLHLHINEEDRKAIGILLQAAFPNLISAEIKEACENSLNHSSNTKYAQLKLDEI